MNALSIFFPLGETFFIHCVERHREFVKPGSQLERDVIAFTAQVRASYLRCGRILCLT